MAPTRVFFASHLSFIPSFLHALTILNGSQPCSPQHRHVHNTQFCPCQGSAHVPQGLSLCVHDWGSSLLGLNQDRQALTFLSKHLSSTSHCLSSQTGLRVVFHQPCPARPLCLCPRHHLPTEATFPTSIRVYLCLTHFLHKTAGGSVRSRQTCVQIAALC